MKSSRAKTKPKARKRTVAARVKVTQPSLGFAPSLRASAKGPARLSLREGFIE